MENKDTPQDKMKILMITSKFPRWKSDPQPAFTYYLAREVAKLGHDVHVIAPHCKGAKKYEIFEGIHTYRFKYFWPESLQKFAYGAGIPANVKNSLMAKLEVPFFILSETALAKNISKKIGPDIIHAHWAFPQGWAAMKTKKRYIVTIYGGEVFLSKRFHLIKTLDKIIKNSYKSFALTTGLREIVKDFGVKSHVDVMPLGVDTDIFRKDIPGYDEIKKKFCPEGEKMVLCVARLVEKKGVEYLIKAFKQAKDSIQKVKLVIVGDGYLYEKLVSLRDSLGLKDDVIFTKEITHDELPKYYCAADLFALPSIIDSRKDRETQGVVYLEAMACGCPVIGTDTGGIPDVISSEDVGILVPEKDPVKLAEAIIKALVDDELRNRLSEQGFRHAVDNFNWKKIAEKYIKVYQEASG